MAGTGLMLLLMCLIEE